MAREVLRAAPMLRKLTCTLSLLAACTGAEEARLAGEQTSALISDGAGFHFLPPVVQSEPPPGTNVTGLAPVVRLTDGAGAVVGSWTTGGAGAGFVRADASCNCYLVNLDTRGLPIADGAPYRVSVLLGTRTLGFADAKFGGNNAELRHLDRTQYVGLVDGATLPFKFRIEARALLSPADAVRHALASAGAEVAGAAIGLASFGVDPGAPITLPETVRVYDADVALDPITTTSGALLVRASELASIAGPAALASEDPVLLHEVEVASSGLALEMIGASEGDAPRDARLYLALAGYESERVRCTLSHALAASTALSDPSRAESACGAAVAAGGLRAALRLSLEAHLDGDAAVAEALAAGDVLGVVLQALKDSIQESEETQRYLLEQLEREEMAIQAQVEETERLRAQAEALAGAERGQAVATLDTSVLAGVALLTSPGASFAGLARTNLDAIEMALLALHLGAPSGAPAECAGLDGIACEARLLASAGAPSLDDITALSNAVEGYLATIPVFPCPIDTEDRTCVLRRILRAQLSDAGARLVAAALALRDQVQLESRRFATLANASKPRHEAALNEIRNLK